MSAVAMAPIPSSRPIKPIRSEVVALMLTWSEEIPMALPNVPLIVCKWLKNWGSWAIIVASTFDVFQPFWHRMSMVFCRSVRLDISL